ncbi:hypothetical protein [Myxococcus xanthus]|uniref:hypothetical protein n=1 Tax=Myxococcus xanthus TaxID=34 RepID=UPI00112D01C7|nr:hypothetical protein [Myxococcus xanthus]QDE83277.1 hypothetical protein BHS07_17905 [Myxococcus xanthus]
MSCLRATTCRICGAVRLGTSLTESGQLAPHAATPANARVVAAFIGVLDPTSWRPWPTCRHDVAWWAGCRNQPVPPPCCRWPPCVLVLPPLLPSVPAHPEDS